MSTSLADTTLFFFGRNRHVAGAVHGLGVLVNILFGAVLSVILQAANSTLGVTAQLGAHFYHAYSLALDTLELNSVDAVVFLCVFGGFVYVLLQIYTHVGKIYSAILIFFLAVKAKDKLIFSRANVILKLPELKHEHTTEAPLSGDFMYSLPDKYPKGVFIVFGKQRDTPAYFMNGHGFVAGNKLWITAHQAAQEYDELYIANPRNMEKLIRVHVDVKRFSKDVDLVEIYGLGACAALGLKSLKWRRYTKTTPVTVIHFDTFDKSYTQQSLYAKPWEENESPFEIKTKSYTTPGDSGMPVLQNGDVVAIHVGFSTSSDNQPEYNISQIPFNLLSELYEKQRQQEVVITHRAETPPTGGDWEKRFQAWQRQQAAEKERYMRGEGDQTFDGYRTKAKSAKPDLVVDDKEFDREQTAFADEFKGLSDREIGKKLASLKVQGAWGNETENLHKELDELKQLVKTLALRISHETPVPGSQGIDLKLPRVESKPEILAAPIVTNTTTTTSGSELLMKEIPSPEKATPLKELNPELLQAATQFSELMDSKASLGELEKCLSKLKSLRTYKAPSPKKQ